MNFDQIKELKKALNTISKAKKKTEVNLGSKKRTNIFLNIFKKQFNFPIIRKNHNTIFITSKTFMDIQKYIKPVINDFYNNFENELSFIQNNLTNYCSKYNQDLRFRYLAELINTRYSDTFIDNYNLFDLDFLNTLKVLTQKMNQETFPIFLSTLVSSIKKETLKKILDKKLIYFHIIPEVRGMRANPKKLDMNFKLQKYANIAIVKELYSLIIMDLEPRIRKFIFLKFEEINTHPFEQIYRDRIPINVKKSIKRNFFKNYAKLHSINSSQEKIICERAFKQVFQEYNNFHSLLDLSLFSGLTRIINKNWNIFKNDFLKINVSYAQSVEEFQRLVIVRNKIGHLIKNMDGEIILLHELKGLNVSLPKTLNFCFGLDTII